MNCIDKLQLQNFQSHKNTAIELAPPGQLTVIVGPSDNGKTAIIRALKLLAYNNPLGTDYIRVGESECAVQGIMADGSKTTRQRTRGGINRYILEPDGQQKQVYEGFGISVPLEVQQMLGMSPISIGDMEINLNLSEQLDGPFLGNAVPVTAKAKVLGKLSGVEEVDHANKMLGTDLYRKKRDKECMENEIKSLVKQIEEYGYLDELGPMTEVVEKTITDLESKANKKQALLELKINLSGVTAAIEKEVQKIASLSNLEGLFDALSATEDKAVKLQKLATASRSYMETQSAIDKVNQTIESTQKVESAYNLIIALSDKSIKLHALQKLRDDRDILTASLSKTEAIAEATKSVEKAIVTVNNLIAKQEKLKQLQALKQKLDQITRESKSYKNVLTSTENIEVLMSKVQEVIAKINKRKALAAYANMKTKNLNEVLIAEKAMADHEQETNRITDELIDLFKEAGTCPMCGNKLEHEKLKEVI